MPPHDPREIPTPEPPSRSLDHPEGELGEQIVAYLTGRWQYHRDAAGESLFRQQENLARAQSFDTARRYIANLLGIVIEE